MLALRPTTGRVGLATLKPFLLLLVLCALTIIALLIVVDPESHPILARLPPTRHDAATFAIPGENPGAAELALPRENYQVARDVPSWDVTAQGFSRNLGTGTLLPQFSTVAGLSTWRAFSCGKLRW